MPDERDRGPKNPDDNNKKRGEVKIFGGHVDVYTKGVSGELSTADLEKTEVVRPFDRTNSIEEIIELIKGLPDLRTTEGELIKRELIASMLLLVQEDLNRTPPIVISKQMLGVFTTNEGLRDAVIREIVKVYAGPKSFYYEKNLDSIIRKFQALQLQNTELAVAGNQPIVLQDSERNPLDTAGYIGRFKYIRDTWLPSVIKKMKSGMSDEEVVNSFIPTEDIGQAIGRVTRGYGLRTALEAAIRLYIIQNRPR